MDHESNTIESSNDSLLNTSNGENEKEEKDDENNLNREVGDVLRFYFIATVLCVACYRAVTSVNCV